MTKTQVLTAPEEVDLTMTELMEHSTLFLAGSIEQGKAENWQEHAIKLLDGVVDYIFNPRRADWDPTWTQESEELKEQIEWELDHLDVVDYTLFYFQPGTLSPVSMMELGMQACVSETLVVCPKGFWREANVLMLCDRFNVPVFETLEDAVGYLKHQLQE